MVPVLQDSPPDGNDFDSLVRKYCVTWDVQEIAGDIQVDFSESITRTLGRTQPASRKVRLNPQLKSQPKGLLDEVICHELAHVVAYHKYGANIRPHGREWQSLVRHAGFDPTVRLAISLETAPSQPAKRYVHRCPVCHSSRTAMRPMHRWRCRDCVNSDLAGDLIIEVAP